MEHIGAGLAALGVIGPGIGVGIIGGLAAGAIGRNPDAAGQSAVSRSSSRPSPKGSACWRSWSASWRSSSRRLRLNPRGPPAMHILALLGDAARGTDRADAGGRGGAASRSTSSGSSSPPPTSCSSGRSCEFAFEAGSQDARGAARADRAGADGCRAGAPATAKPAEKEHLAALQEARREAERDPRACPEGRPGSRATRSGGDPRRARPPSANGPPRRSRPRSSGPGRAARRGRGPRAEAAGQGRRRVADDDRQRGWCRNSWPRVGVGRSAELGQLMARADTSARRYAEAAFEIAQRDARSTSGATICRQRRRSSRSEHVARVVENPAIPLVERGTLVAKLLAKRIADSLPGWSTCWSRAAALDLLARVADEYRRLLQRHQGIVRAS